MHKKNYIYSYTDVLQVKFLKIKKKFTKFCNKKIRREITQNGKGSRCELMLYKHIKYNRIKRITNIFIKNEYMFLEKMVQIKQKTCSFKNCLKQINICSEKQKNVYNNKYVYRNTIYVFNNQKYLCS